MALKTTSNYSPNFNPKKRPFKQIKFIIFHYTGMKKELEAINKLKNIQSQVSCHYLIKNNGKIITMVPNSYIAWHAGISSWKNFNSQKLLLIKYEDMINNKENTLKNILVFLNKLIKNKFELNQTKIENIISSTSFEKMKDLEKKNNFSEASIDKKTGKAIPFFYLGDQSKSEKLLDINNKNKIENAFKAEMKELGYL